MPSLLARAAAPPAFLIAFSTRERFVMHLLKHSFISIVKPSLLSPRHYATENKAMVDTSDKAIGARLKQALESRRETQAALAEVTGVSPQAVGLWLKTGEIERKNLIAACKWLGVSL